MHSVPVAGIVDPGLFIVEDMITHSNPYIYVIAGDLSSSDLEAIFLLHPDRK